MIRRIISVIGTLLAGFLLCVPWEGILLNYHIPDDIGTFEFYENVLALRIRLRSNWALDLLLESSSNIYGGFAISHSNRLCEALRIAGDVRFASSLARVSIPSQTRARDLLRAELEWRERGKNLDLEYPRTFGPSP